MQTEIILVHGLWNRGWYMALMAARLRARGHAVRVFSYATRRRGLDGHADLLREFIGRQPAGELHLAGHSMGGLVILNMLDRYEDVPPGRVVLMGTPVRGSRVIRRLQKLPVRAVLFGRAAEGLLRGYRQPPPRHETGVIRGTRSLGLGRIAGVFDGPNDGSVAASETQLQGVTDSIDMNVAHTQMLISRAVTDQLEHFVLHGCFLHPGGLA